MQAWILCQNSNGYFFDTERPVEPMPIFSIPSVLPVVTVFLQKTSNGYVTSSTLYKGTPWFISVAFLHLENLRPPLRRRDRALSKREKI